MNFDTHSHPQVVATVTEQSDLNFLESEKNPACDVLEFRLDNLLAYKNDALQVMTDRVAPVLTTVRSPLEGGSGDLDAEARTQIYKEFLPVSNLIDIEVGSLQDGGFSEVMRQAQSHGCLRIGSFHDFGAFPGIDVLRKTIREAFDHDAEIAKVAVYMDERDQLYSLAQLVAEIRETGKLISAMGMGPLGKLSRLVLPEAGSCLNYGYLQVANAPGQWAAAELHSLLKQINE